MSSVSVRASKGSLISTTHIALLEVGEFCKFNSLDGRPVDAMLIRTDERKVAERLAVSYFLEARWPSARNCHTLSRDDSLFFWHTLLHLQPNLAVLDL